MSELQEQGVQLVASPKDPSQSPHHRCHYNKDVWGRGFALFSMFHELRKLLSIVVNKNYQWSCWYCGIVARCEPHNVPQCRSFNRITGSYYSQCEAKSSCWSNHGCFHQTYQIAFWMITGNLLLAVPAFWRSSRTLAPKRWREAGTLFVMCQTFQMIFSTLILFTFCQVSDIGQRL